MLGVVNLDKPVGPTSHDMVGLLRRLTGTRRIGHAGTLDPLASGVLPILVGAATRVSEELTGGRKRYDAVIRLGARSETDDAEGPIVPGTPAPDRPTIEAALQEFVGTFDQRPPAFSARKQAGRTAHRAARAGDPMDLPPRRVTVDSLDLLEVRGAEDGGAEVRIDLRCGAGTYVRSIARDLGERLGCGGYLAALRRTEAAGLRVEDAVTPEHLEALAAAGRLGDAFLPVGAILPLPQVSLTADAAWRFTHGSTHALDGASDGRVAVFHDATLLGIGRVEEGVLHPDKVLSTEPAA
jgi:tRNA pseudouridine55 synthase